MTRARQHDAHVRARTRLLKRIADRRYDWGIPTRLRDRARREGRDLHAVVLDDAAARLAAFRWPANWAIKLSPYHPYHKRTVLGVYTRVPADILHMIMTTHIEDPS